GPWRENRSASMLAVLCDGSASVSFADPRGKWSRNWPGSVPMKVRGELLGLEPKAPFHWHSEVHCKEGEAILIPGWLRYKLSSAETVRAYSLAALRGSAGAQAGAPLGQRAPRPPPLCVDASTFAGPGSSAHHTEL
ncbi:unnamed protein product, partial [Symbiodinium sp. CCMP2456]